MYIAGSYDTPEIRGCAFLLNSSGKDGGAVNVSGGKGIDIKGSVFAQDRADGNGGGIYVDSRYDINVCGKVVIKDNTAGGQNSRNDLCLQSGVASTAYISGGGLYEGSLIYLSSTKGDGKNKIAQDYSEFHRAQYIRGGSIALILTGLMVMILAVLGICIYRARKRKKSKTAEEKNGEV